MDANGNPVYKTPTGETETILMDGSNIASAQAGMNGTEYVVQLKLKDANVFKDITTQYINQTVSIWLDDEMISYPTVESTITNGEAVINGLQDAEEAQDLATKINAGALPFKLETTSFGSVDPTLGESALVAMAYAAIAALIFMAIFLIAMYRLPGFIAVITLLGQMSLSVAAISGFFTVIPSFTMTLPGIAGLILSIGMGADANIITAERVREELRNGKTIDGAVMAGTKGSFWAIFDGNITVIIVSIILLLVFGPVNILSGIFGPSTTGTIYSFGYTLLVGVISNFIMGVGASRLMLKSASGIKPLRKNGCLEVLISNEKIMDFTGKSKIFFGISIAIFVIGIVCNFIFGVTLDIQFTGGTIIQYNYVGEVDTDKMKDLIQSETADTVSFNISDNITVGEDGSQLQNGYLLAVQFSGKQTITPDVMNNVTEKLQEAFPDNNVKWLTHSLLNLQWVGSSS